MSRYRKKPVVIDAYEFHNRVGPDTRPSWLLEAVNAGIVTFHNRRDAPGYLTIDTLEGQMRANAGDWIIRGIAGEIYPCKPDIFAATYEPAPNTKDQTMGDPKEALERLQIIARHFESRGSLYARCVRVDHLSALIAEREGLEREVERLTNLLDKLACAHNLRAEAAEAKLSALEEVVRSVDLELIIRDSLTIRQGSTDGHQVNFIDGIEEAADAIRQALSNQGKPSS